MINNQLGFKADYIQDINNILADSISRVFASSNTSFDTLFQNVLQIVLLRRFHPSHELLSHLFFALLTGQDHALIQIKNLGHFTRGKIISQNLYTTALAYSNNKLILAKAEEGVFTEMEYNYNFNTEWHHIALLHIESGNSNFLYVDGAFAGSTTLELATPDYSNARLKISESPGGIRFGNFSIDDFLVYNRVLSSSELVNLASVSVGVDENTNSLMELYPNPAYDFVTIQNLEVGSTIVVLDVTGQSVFTSTVVNSSETLDLSTWIRGMYFVQVQQNGVLIGTKKLQVH